MRYPRYTLKYDSRPINGAGIILFNGKKQYLIVFSKCKKWGFPKGHLEFDESFKNCAEREMKEETGITLKIPEKLSFILYIYHYIYYGIKISDGDKFTLNPLDTQEIDEARWMTMKEIKTIPKELRNSSINTFLCTCHSR